MMKYRAYEKMVDMSDKVVKLKNLITLQNESLDVDGWFGRAGRTKLEKDWNPTYFENIDGFEVYTIYYLYQEFILNSVPMTAEYDGLGR